MRPALVSLPPAPTTTIVCLLPLWAQSGRSVRKGPVMWWRFLLPAVSHNVLGSLVGLRYYMSRYLLVPRPYRRWMCT